jgi:hypothetical protein
MKNQIFIKIFLFILVFTIVVSGQNQNYRENVSKRGTTAASFLEIGVGARALAMGSAFTAMADDPSTIYWNVAGLAKLKRHGILVNHTEWIADTRFDFLAASFNVGSYGTVGFSLTSLSMDEMEVTTIEAPEGNGQTFRVNDFALSLAYALRLTDRFSIGMNTKVIRQVIWEMSATGYALDLGVHYVTPFKGVNLGMSMTNFGTSMQMSGVRAQILYDPDPIAQGNNDRIPARIQMDSWALPLNFRVGISYQAFKNEVHQAYISIDAQHPNNNYESLNIGAEYVFKNMLAIRGGYKSLFLADSEESLTLGTGLYYPILGNVLLRFDFAYVDFGLLENVYKYSVGIDF